MMWHCVVYRVYINPAAPRVSGKKLFYAQNPIAAAPSPLLHILPALLLPLFMSVGAKICLHQRSWSRGSRGRRRDLQGKSKSEVGLLRQDPPTLKSVLCLNKNGVLERRI